MMMSEETLHDAVSNLCRRFGIHLMIFAYLQEEIPGSLELSERAAIFSRIEKDDEEIPSNLGAKVAGLSMDALRVYADGINLRKTEE